MTKTIEAFGLKPRDIIVTNNKNANQKVISVRNAEVVIERYSYCEFCDESFEYEETTCPECDENLERTYDASISTFGTRTDGSLYNSYLSVYADLTEEDRITSLSGIEYEVFRPTHDTDECRNYRKVEPNET